MNLKIKLLLLTVALPLAVACTPYREVGCDQPQDASCASEPELKGDFYVVSAGSALEVSKNHGVLSNDVGGAAKAVLGETTAHGALTFRSDGSFRYVPRAGFDGDDRFTYGLRGGETLAQVVIRVQAVREARPVARGDAYLVPGAGVLLVHASEGLLANDAANGGLLSARVTEFPRNGTLSLQADGAFHYAPAPGFTGIDSFEYVATTGSVDSVPVRVILCVGDVRVPILPSRLPAPRPDLMTESEGPSRR